MSATAPLEILSYQEHGTDTLIVFLRGLGGNHHSFADEGLVDDVRSRNINVDMVAPNAHFSYYAKRTLLKRLHQDVIAPAQAAGYRKIWLVGVSMGGLGSLLYIRERPWDIAGVYLLAPFLGYDDGIATITTAGGVAQWQAGRYNPEDEWQTMLWDWIKKHLGDAGLPPIYLGYGLNDRYVKGQKLLETVLPPNRVIVIPGSHDFITIRRLWQQFLDVIAPF